MAYERLSDKKIIATNLDSYIGSLMALMSRNTLVRNLEDESNFNKAVLEDNLNLEQQLEYRRNQLKRVGNDKEERIRIRKEISSLTNQIEQKKYSDAYLDELDRLNEGTQSIETTLNWLTTRLSNTTDSDIKKSIRENINSLKDKLYNQQQTALSKQTEFATNDRTISVLDKQIDNVNNAKAKALTAGNNDYVALLDLQLQNLSKAKTEAKVTKTLTDFSVATVAGQSSLALLNSLNKEIDAADGNTPVNIGGTRYDSAKAFWEGRRGEYLNDRTANGFFTRYQTELAEKVDYKNSKGILNNDTFADVKTWYDFIKDRPELADYKDRIQLDQQTALKTTAEYRAQSITNEFAVKLDAKKAISDLAHIQDTYGVDMSTQYQKVIVSAAKEKEEQVRNIIETMGQLMKDNPGMSSQDAIEQAAKLGAGAMYSPEELANKNAADIINEGANKSASQLKDNQVTIDPKTKPGKTFASPNLTEGGLYKIGNDTTVYKFENGKLRTMIGNFDENTFKQATGKTFNEVQTIENITGVPTGPAIQAVDFAPKPVVPAQKGEKIFSPDLLQYYKPDEIISEGQDKFLRADVKPVWGKILKPDEFTQMQKQFDPATLEKKIVRAGKDIYLKQ